jgi:hypothetical protein
MNGKVGGAFTHSLTPSLTRRRKTCSRLRMKPLNVPVWLALSLVALAGATVNATLPQRRNTSTPLLSNATRLRLAAMNLQNVTLAGLRASRQSLETAAKGVQQGLHSSYAWAAQASAPILEDVQLVATQQLHALRDAANDARVSVVQLCRSWLRRSPSVSRILLRARQEAWYELLQVRRRANKRQLKDAYRRLAKRVHPDKTQDSRAERAFSELRDAFDLLSDERKRKAYDEKLARQDQIVLQRRLHQRQVAYRVTSRALRRLWAWAWLHRKWTVPVVILCLVRVLL